MIGDGFEYKFSEIKLGKLKSKIGFRYISYFFENDEKYFLLGGIDKFSNISNGITCIIKFKKFERLSLESSRKDELASDLNSSIRPYIHNKLMPFEFGKGIYEHFPLVLKTESDIDLLLQYIKKYYWQDAKLFFEYWKDIRMFLPFIEGDDENALELLGNLYILRKMVVWKLCNHPGYENFVNQRIEILQNVLKDDPENKDYLYVLNEIKLKYEELRTVSPDYEWNPTYLEIKPFKPEIL